MTLNLGGNELTGETLISVDSIVVAEVMTCCLSVYILTRPSPPSYCDVTAYLCAGEIPVSLGNLTSMRSLFLQDNLLVGESQCILLQQKCTAGIGKHNQ